MITWRKLGSSLGLALLLVGFQSLQNNTWAMSSCGLMPKTYCSTGWYCDVGGWACDGDTTPPAPAPAPSPSPTPTPTGPQAYSFEPNALITNNSATVEKKFSVNAAGQLVSLFTVRSSVASYQVQYTNPTNSQQRPGTIDYLMSAEMRNIVKVSIWCKSPVALTPGTNMSVYTVGADNLTMADANSNCTVTSVITQQR